jgi:hypothetical protein
LERRARPRPLLISWLSWDPSLLFPTDHIIVCLICSSICYCLMIDFFLAASSSIYSIILLPSSVSFPSASNYNNCACASCSFLSSYSFAAISRAYFSAFARLMA